MRLKHYWSVAFIVASGFTLTACNDQSNGGTSAASTAPSVSHTLAPIVIQGAMPTESEYMASKLQNVTVETVGGWKFWKGTYNGYPMVISKTLMGMTDAAAATAIAIERYKPIAIINQGTAGGHDPSLHVFDIVLGQTAANIGAFMTPKVAAGGGSNSLSWTPMDVLPDNEGDLNLVMRKFAGDTDLLTAAHSVEGQYSKGKVVDGLIGSSDVWNNELDRISMFHNTYGTEVEEMETASVAQVASLYKVPFLGIRILSNNITNDGSYDINTAVACQDYALAVASAYMAAKAGK